MVAEALKVWTVEQGLQFIGRNDSRNAAISLGRSLHGCCEFQVEVLILNHIGIYNSDKPDSVRRGYGAVVEPSQVNECWRTAVAPKHVEVRQIQRHDHRPEAIGYGASFVLRFLSLTVRT
jgi:hypothetical protein